MNCKPYIRAHADELLESLAALVRIPSVEGVPEEHAPFGREPARALHETLALCEKLGFRTGNMDDRVGWCEYGEGEEMVAVLGHLDVVPAGDGWTRDPWGGEIADGKIFGRGTMDDKGPALAALHAMRAVREAGIPMADGVKLILGCDEETGMTDMEYYKSKLPAPDYGFSPDAEFPVINIEKGGLGLILFATGGTDHGLNYILLIISILCMSLFFSIHYLTIYYLLQPYNAGTELKSGTYSVVISVTYLVCFFLMRIRMSILLFGIMTIVFCVTYSIAACILIYRFAPKNFRLRT